MNISHDLDYLQYTTNAYVPIDDAVGNLKPIPAFGGYTEAWQDEVGTRVLKNRNNPQMKTLVINSGDTLNALRKMNFSDKKILHHALWLDAVKIGRVDLAVTVDFKEPQYNFLPHVFHHYALNGMMESKLELDNPVSDEKQNIQTCYIGSRKARNRLIRIYDKGIDLGTVANQIIRVEMETRKNAERIAIDAAAGKDYAGLIKRYVDFPNVPAWKEVMESEPIPNWHSAAWHNTPDDKLKEEQSRRWQWLMNSVAPALARAMYEDDKKGMDNVTAFLDAVAWHTEKLRQTD